jgi:hypothetical protein
MGKSNKIVLVGGNLASAALDTDATLAGNSDAAVATQKAVKTYIDAQNESGADTVLVGAALADGKIIVGDGAGASAAVTPSGDVTISNTGVMTIGAGAVEESMLADDIPRVITAVASDIMSREENVAGLSSAITLANEIRADFINHAANETRHTSGAQDTTGLGDACTDLATLKALAGDLLTAYAAHNADAILTEAWAYHAEQATTKALTSDVTPTTLVEAVTRLNDLKTKYNDHEDETTGHASESSVTADQVAASDAAYGVTNRVPVSGALADDTIWWSILDDGTGNVTGVDATAGTDYVDFEFSADPQNDAIISYMVVRPAAA